MHGLCSLVLACFWGFTLQLLLLSAVCIALHFRRRSARVMACLTLLYYHCLDRVWTHLYCCIYVPMYLPAVACTRASCTACCLLAPFGHFIYSLTVTGLMFCCCWLIINRERDQCEEPVVFFFNIYFVKVVSQETRTTDILGRREYSVFVAQGFQFCRSVACVELTLLKWKRIYIFPKSNYVNRPKLY